MEDQPLKKGSSRVNEKVTVRIVIEYEDGRTEKIHEGRAFEGPEGTDKIQEAAQDAENWAEYGIA